jgi:hypothetical protein
MHEERVERAVGDFFDANEALAGIEQDDLEGFNIEAAIFFAEQIGNAIRVIQHRGLVAQRGSHALGEGKGGFKGDGFVAAHAFDLANVVKRRGGKVFEGAEFF